MSSPAARYQRRTAWGAPPAGQGRDTPTELEKVTRCREAFTKYSRVEITSSLLTVRMIEKEKGKGLVGQCQTYDVHYNVIINVLDMSKGHINARIRTS